MLGLKLNHVCERGCWCPKRTQGTIATLSLRYMWHSSFWNKRIMISPWTVEDNWSRVVYKWAHIWFVVQEWPWLYKNVGGLQIIAFFCDVGVHEIPWSPGSDLLGRKRVWEVCTLQDPNKIYWYVYKTSLGIVKYHMSPDITMLQPTWPDDQKAITSSASIRQYQTCLYRYFCMT